MCSFEETAIEKLDTNSLIKYNTHLMSRSYPKGTRVSSDNYDPVPFWNQGMQLVALNFQGAGRSMWLNTARFADNGGSGECLLSHPPTHTYAETPIHIRMRGSL